MAGAAAAVLVVAVVVVTGFVAPGFFLPDDEPAPPATRDNPPPESGAQEQIVQVAEQAVAAINTRDVALARSVSCSPQDAGNTDDLPPDARAELSGDPQLQGTDKATVPVRFTADGQSEQEQLTLELRDGRWCVGS